MKLATFAILGVLLVLAALTWWVLESSEVAVVTTRRPDGGSRSTHVWYVRDDGELWLEAGSARNGWYRDVLDHSEVELALADETQAFVAEPASEVAAQRRVRTLVRRKYGFRDIWIGFFVDHSEAVPVRLVPVGGARGSTSTPSAIRGPSGG